MTMTDLENHISIFAQKTLCTDKASPQITKASKLTMVKNYFSNN